jgi:hypothetical protein
LCSILFNLNLTLYQNVVIRLPNDQQYFVYDDHLKCCHPVLFYCTRLILCSEEHNFIQLNIIEIFI